MAIRITPDQVNKAIVGRAKAVPGAMERGARRGLTRGQALLTRKMPVDMGQLRAGWHVSRGPKPELYNDAPHAGIVELGARPHPVSREGREAIARWFERKVGMPREEAESASFALAQKIRREGQKGTFIVRDSMDEIRRFVVEEVIAEVKKQAASRQRGDG